LRVANAVGTLKGIVPTAVNGSAMIRCTSTPLVALGVCIFSFVTARAGDAPVDQKRESTSEKSDGDWDTGTPAEVGLRAAPLNEMIRRIKDGTYKNIHSALVVRHGKLALEEYFAGTNAEGKDQVFGRDTLHSLQSCTKSVNSILIGIAIDQHLMPGVEEKISTFFPKYADLFTDPGKGGIRLKDCLSMTSGLAWTESGIPYTDPRNDAYGVNRSPDPVRYVFERPVEAPAGERFLYHTGISIMLGEMLHQASGQYANEFAERNLFGPLGITRYRWGKLPDGTIHTGGGLWMRPLDMAKIGLLYLNGGRWKERQIVSENWVRDSVKQQAPYRGYGYQWWLRTFRTRDRAIDAFAAQGLGGQFIFVVPDLKMVAVFTGWNQGALTEQPLDMMQRYVVPAADAP
jgi:CubicO group peptidase (beta-lactamase class C family)